MSQVLEGRRVFTEFTVEENLRVGGHTRKNGRAEAIAEVYDLFPILAERRRSTAGYLSGGEQQMLAMGAPWWPARRSCCLMNNDDH